MRELAVTVELVGITTGLWCRTCLLSTGVIATVALTGPVRSTLTSRRRCTECGGHDVEVE